MKPIVMLASLLCAVVVSGCATVSLDGNGGTTGYSDWEANDIVKQMAKDSEGA